MQSRRASAALFGLILAACSAGSAASPSGAELTSTAFASPTASEALQPSASTSAVPSPVPVPEDWTPVLTVGDGSDRTTAAQITHGTAGFLGLVLRWTPIEGSPGPGFAEPSLWQSSNGLEWSEIAYPSDFGNLSTAALTTAADGSYVLHGSRGTIAGTERVALRSSDGETWEEFATGLSDVIYIQAIARGPAGYLLVGGQGFDANPTLWLSAEGFGWELVHEFEQTTHWVQIHDADGGAEGYVVIGRKIEPESNTYQRFALASSDGRQWFEQNQPFGPDNQAYVFEANVSSLGPDWVATLGHPDAPTEIRFSPNGLDWSVAGSVDAPGSTSAGLLEEMGNELLFSPGSGLGFEGTVGVWSSADGAAWSELELGTEAWLSGMAQSETMVAVIGTIPSENFTSVATVWVRASD